MRKHDVALHKSGIKFTGIITTIAVVDAFIVGCVAAAQFHLFTNWNRYSGGDRCVICHTNKHTCLSMWGCILYVYLCGSAYCMFIYVGVHTVCLSMWECILYVYLCGGAYCMFIYVGVHTVCLSMWGCILYVYLCGGAYCMFNFITIIKPIIIPSIRRV